MSVKCIMLQLQDDTNVAATNFPNCILSLFVVQVRFKTNKEGLCKEHGGVCEDTGKV